MRNLTLSILIWHVEKLRDLVAGTHRADIPNMIICLLGALGFILYYFTGSAQGLMR
jgi:hypothetical protein